MASQTTLVARPQAARSAVPAELTPRERLLRLGPAALSDAELLAEPSAPDGGQRKWRRLSPMLGSHYLARRIGELSSRRKSLILKGEIVLARH